MSCALQKSRKVGPVSNGQHCYRWRDTTLFEPANDDEIVTALVTALTRALNDGSPVAANPLRDGER